MEKKKYPEIPQRVNPRWDDTLQHNTVNILQTRSYVVRWACVGTMAKTTQNDTYIKYGYLFSVFLYGYDAVPSKCLTYLNLIKHSLLLTFMAVLRYNGVRTMGAGRRAPRLLQATMMMMCARVFDCTNFSASNFVFFFHPHRFSTPIVFPPPSFTPSLLFDALHSRCSTIKYETS